MGRRGALPDGCSTVPNIARLFQERTAHLSYDVSILNSRYALVDFGVPYRSNQRDSWGNQLGGVASTHRMCSVWKG